MGSEEGRNVYASAKLSIFYSLASLYKMPGTCVPKDWQIWFPATNFIIGTPMFSCIVLRGTRWGGNKWKLRVS